MGNSTSFFSRVFQQGLTAIDGWPVVEKKKVKIVASGLLAVLVVVAMVMASTSYACGCESGGRSHSLSLAKQIAYAALNFQKDHNRFPYNVSEVKAYLRKGTDPSKDVLRISRHGNVAIAHVVVTDLFHVHLDQDFKKTNRGWFLNGAPRVANLN